jgi:hypothetical protein
LIPSLRNAFRATRRGRLVLLSSIAIGLLAAPFALGATGQSPIGGGTRNPSVNATSSYSKETQIIGSVAQNQGGLAANTGGYVTRQSNKSDSGGGAIYGCRAKAGTEACVSANNLNNGDAFRFQAEPGANTIGVLRFGLDATKTVDKAPFVTNGTGMVANLNADKVDGRNADDFAPKTALTDYVAKNSLLFAAVAADGTIGANRGVPSGARATVSTSGSAVAFTVPLAGDVSACAYTASPTAGGLDAPPVVSTGDDRKSVVVTEDPTASAVPFHLQVTC